MSTLRCDACGIHENPLLIDGKPSDGDFENVDFDRMECIACYGPGYTMIAPEHVTLSIVPAFAGLYEAWAEWRRLAGVVWC